MEPIGYFARRRDRTGSRNTPAASINQVDGSGTTYNAWPSAIEVPLAEKVNIDVSEVTCTLGVVPEPAGISVPYTAPLANALTSCAPAPPKAGLLAQPRLSNCVTRHRYQTAGYPTDCPTG